MYLYIGYPEHSEHFYIPDADSSVKLWANALNEVYLIGCRVVDTFQPLKYLSGVTDSGPFNAVKLSL